MDVETARSTQSSMANNYSQLTSLLQSMNTTVNGLQPSWMGNSATEFFAEYETWRTNMNTLLDSLNNLSTRLSSEITEWETMASKLS